MARLDTGYRPQPKQQMFHECLANEVLYGGAAGPGKSHALRHEGLDWALRIPGLQVYLFRRTFPELEKNHIIPSLVEFPAGVGKYREQKRRWEFYNGSMLHFCHCQYEHDVFQYQGAEIHLLLIDELTTFTEFQYDYLRARVRCALDIPKEMQYKIPGIGCGSNPGGIGHEFVKRRWVDYGKPYELKRADKKEGGMLRCFIPGLLADNKILMERDPGYEDRLDALPEPYRTAYKDGNWDIFLGQAFLLTREHHIIPPIAVPDYVKIYMTFDWGYGKPFSLGWWWFDNDGRAYRFNEWYGWNGTPNEGIRLTDKAIAEGIVERENIMGIVRRDITRLAGADCFAKKPNYQTGEQGKSTAEVFSEHNLILNVVDASRLTKIKQFRERLRIPKDKEGNVVGVPMMQIYDTCEQFIRTVSLLQTDSRNVEDVDTNMEDHIYDESCHICMIRQITNYFVEKEKLTGAAADWATVKGISTNQAINLED